MAVPSTNIKMSDIYAEANGGGYAIDMSVVDLFQKSYFEGPTGSATIGYNAWGQWGNTSGDNRIYNLTSKNTDNAWTDFSLKTYFYDNATYLCQAYATNSMPGGPFPINNDVFIDIALYDSSYTYIYATSSSPCNQGTSPITFTITPPVNSPIIAVGYWVVNITTNNSQPPINMLMDINGINYVNSSLPANSITGFDSATYGTVNIAYNGTMGATGLYFRFTFQP